MAERFIVTGERVGVFDPVDVYDAEGQQYLGYRCKWCHVVLVAGSDARPPHECSGPPGGRVENRRGGQMRRGLGLPKK